jgi:hypothetical protein
MNSQEIALEEVRERLSKLEKQNRKLKQTGAAALVVAGSLLVMGQVSPTRTVEANEFTLKDGSGKVRARLGMYRDPTASPDYPEEPRLALFDEKGQQRVTLTGDGYGPMLALYDRKGHPRLNVGIVLDAGLLYMSDEHGTLTRSAVPRTASNPSVSNVSNRSQHPGTMQCLQSLHQTTRRTFQVRLA